MLQLDEEAAPELSAIGEGFVSPEEVRTRNPKSGTQNSDPCRDTSLTRNTPLLGPYSRTIPRVLWWSWEGGAILMSEVLLYPKPGSIQKCLMQVTLIKKPKTLDRVGLSR